MAKKRSGANKVKSAAAGSSAIAVRSRIPLVSLWAVGAFLAALVLNAAPPGPAFNPDVNAYWLRGTVLVFAIAALVASWSAARILPAYCAQLLSAPSAKQFAAIVALTALALSVAAAIYSFNLHPIAADELAQLWHAKMLAAGRLYLPADPNPEFFAIDNVIDTGRWYSQYPIGGPAVLAVGVLIGAPWLINPLLAGATSIAIYHFMRSAYGELEGRAIAALLAISPMFVLMSGSHMNHVPVLFLMSVAMAAMVELDREVPRFKSSTVSAVIGLTIGLIADIRPLDAAVAALAIGTFQLVLVFRGRMKVSDFAVQAVAGTVALIPLLAANWATTGHPLRFGYNVMWGSAHQIGFHVDPTGAVHTPERAIAYFASYVSDLNVYVEMWPVPCLAAAIATLLMLRRVTFWDAFLLAFFWLQVVAYALYWHRGLFIGPRFLYTALPTVIVLLARLPFTAGDRFGARGRRFALATILLCIVGSIAVPFRLEGAIGGARDLRLSRPLFKADIAAAARDSGLHNALVFVNEPFFYRLNRRLWGLGVNRSDASVLINGADACSLLSAIIANEADTVTPRGPLRTKAIALATDAFKPGPRNVPSLHPSLHYNSVASFTEACRTENLNDPKYGVATFGPALIAETIDEDGRLSGDVIYAADLGDRNEILRRRFGSRTWYRLSVQRMDEPGYRVAIRPY